jgi:hypothetical protein
MTMTETRRPKQFGGQESKAEKRFDEVMESIKDLIPRKSWIELSDLAAGRAIDSFDYGVLVGLGKLPPDTGAFRDDAIVGVSEALTALSRYVEYMAERV